MKRNLILVVIALVFTVQVQAVYYASSDMSVEEKVGQVLMVHFRGESANACSDRLIRDLHVGGIIYYRWSNGLHNPRHVKHLSKTLQASAKIPLLIAVDQEGGRVNRLTEGFTVYPSNREIAKSGDLERAKKNAYHCGMQLLHAGINMNLAPVVDVDSNPLNPVIGDRSYSNQAHIVAMFAEAALSGYQQAGIIPVLKHFPGHGDTGVDSHSGLPTITKALAALEKTELYPFRELIHLADVIMTAHIVVTELDSTQCATLSEIILTDLLRKKMGFQGVIISDSLVMKGVLDCCGTIEEAALRAINAGCDIILLGGLQLDGSEKGMELSTNDVARIHKSLVSAVLSGALPQSRLNEAVERILSLKNRHVPKECFE